MTTTPPTQGEARDAARAVVEFTWLGQAGFLLRGDGVTVLIDAFLSDVPERMYPPPLDPASLRDVDVILCTHEHRDHFDTRAVAAVATASPHAVVVVPEPVVPQVLALGIAPARVIGARDGESVGGLPVHLNVSALPAEHGVHMTDAYGFGRAHAGAPSRYLGYVVELAGVTVFHGGDTLWWDGMEEALRAHHVDVVLLPINGRDRDREARDIVGNMDAREGALVAAGAKADVFVPMHWDAWRGNLGFPEQAVTTVTTLGLDVTVVVPRVLRPFRYVARRPSSR